MLMTEVVAEADVVKLFIALGEVGKITHLAQILKGDGHALFGGVEYQLVKALQAEVADAGGIPSARDMHNNGGDTVSGGEIDRVLHALVYIHIFHAGDPHVIDASEGGMDGLKYHAILIGLLLQSGDGIRIL